jgi:hypothetical protein
MEDREVDDRAGAKVLGVLIAAVQYFLTHLVSIVSE